MSAFFHARQSSELLPEHAQKFNLKPASTRKRGILHERSQSEINRENGEQQPTIRLVNSSSSLQNVYDKTPFPHMPSQVLQPTKGSKHGYTIESDEGSSSLDTKNWDQLQPEEESNTLQPRPMTSRQSNRSSNVSRVSAAARYYDQLQEERSSTLRPRPMTSRQSNRSSNLSQVSAATSFADTLLNDSLFSPTSCRFSADTTLRNTPTPMMSEEKEAEREAERLQEESLTPVEETSFESSTIRPVTASTSTPSSGSRDSDKTEKPNYVVYPGSRNDSIADTPEAGPAGPPFNVSSPSQYSSSPPDDSRSSSWNIIRYATSSESMASVQYPHFRPATATSQSASSWSEEDSLPPLSVPRRRRHMHSASVGAVNISNLSTIISESEPSSHSNTRSNTGLFSESSSFDIFTSPPVLGTSSSQSANWYVRRRTIASSSYSSLASEYRSLSAQNSEWDLRAGSAVPEPLFSSSSPRATQSSPMVGLSSSPMIEHPSSEKTVYELPGDFPSEQDDTIAELQAPPLRSKRSGYLTRGRSQSDPRPNSARSNYTVYSVGAGDRTSQGSSIFPQWAKSFYRGKARIPDAYGSSTSLPLTDSQMQSPSQSVRMMPWAYHRRGESAGNSFISSPATATSPYNTSPHSSHFLPSIFRPFRHRRPQNGRSQSTGTMTGTMTGTQSSSLADVYVDESRLNLSDNASSHSHDSMAITPVMPNTRNETLPRRQRTVNSGRAIPRDSSSNYPRSLSASRIYATPPHLAPSRRLSHRLSAWRAPSFDEALNTLIISRGNRQILLFCCGFLCPILWMVAAVLPLPLRPMDATMNNLEASVQDLDELNSSKGRFALGVQMEMMDWEQERRHLKARWWRNLNRIMSVVGVGIIGAIIALAVVASK